MFLHPYALNQDSQFKGFVEAVNDTLTLTFDEQKHPVIVDSHNEKPDLDFSIESSFFTNSSGKLINSWMFRPTKQEYNGTTIYFLHGNAGNVVYHYNFVTPFVKKGFQVFMIDYSGFGFSEGEAKRKLILKDANEGLDYLIKRGDIRYDKLLIYGQSLGGHLAGVVASQNKNKIDGVVIEGGFSSHKNVASDMVPILGHIFVREMYSAKRAVRDFGKPILIIHSTEDEVVNYKHGEKLYNAAIDPKSMYTIDKPHIRGPLFYADSIIHKMEKMTE